MKRLICLTFAFLLVLGTVLAGCAQKYDKTPAEFENIKWVTPDYSFRFNPSDDCKGNYNYKDTKYNIKVEFESSRFSVKDLDKDKELFYGDWSYEDKDYLFMSNIVFNKDDYEDFESNLNAFYRLNQEALK